MAYDSDVSSQPACRISLENELREGITLSLFTWLFTILYIRVKKAQKTNKLTQLKKTVHRRAKLTFVPHGANQYRPHLTRRYGLVVLLLLFIGLQTGYNFTTTGSVLSAKVTISTEDLLEKTNNERAKEKLPTLKTNDRLAKAAFLKANDMIKRQYWAHVAPDGTTPWLWLSKAGYEYGAAGENLAKNFVTADAAMAAWMASPEHRKNILDAQYREVGFAVVNGEMDSRPVTLVVALYGQPAGVLAATTTTGAAPIEAPSVQPLGLLARVSVALESLTPSAIIAVMIVLVAAAVALTSHFYRHKLPKRMRQSWYRHHGILKSAGMFSLIVIVVFLYSGGQI